MRISPFKLERYFTKYEFSAPYLLSCSDCEPLLMQEVIELADEQMAGIWNNLKLAYTESRGHPLLLEEISSLYSLVSAEEVLTIVPEEGIFIAMNSVLHPGDHVITTFPGYQSLYQIAASIGCRISKWEPSFEGSWKFDVDTLKKLIKKDTKLIIINFPHNPTGATISRNDLDEIIGMARKKNIILFSDEMYRYLEYDPSIRLPSATDLYENTVSLSGLSKSFALPGLRMGWLTTKNINLINEFSRFRDYTTICNNAAGEILSIMALRAKEKIISRNLKIIGENLDLLNLFFKEHTSLFKWTKPICSSVAFPQLNHSMRISEFCRKLVDQKGVMLVPAETFNFKGNYFRIGFGRKNMPEALEKLEEFVKLSFDRKF